LRINYYRGTLQDAFGSELGKLSKIRSELLPKKAAKKKAMRMSLAAKADSMPEHKLSTATQSALDKDEAKDVAENHKMAEADDMGDFFAAGVKKLLSTPLHSEYCFSELFLHATFALVVVQLFAARCLFLLSILFCEMQI